jgi:hypothetical protein
MPHTLNLLFQRNTSTQAFSWTMQNWTLASEYGSWIMNKKMSKKLDWLVTRRQYGLSEICEVKAGAYNIWWGPLDCSRLVVSMNYWTTF